MIPVEVLRQEFRYDPKTGLLWWKRPGLGRRLNRPAGRSDKSRHVTVGFMYQQYMAHHIIWALKTGKWPKKEIDHKNRIRSDNRWRNLRLATTTQNRANSSLRCDNTSGVKGVSWHALRRKWRVRVYVGGKEKHLGLFTNFKTAGRTYQQAAKQSFGEFAHAAKTA